MEKLLDGFLSVIEILFVAGTLTWGTTKGLTYVYDQVRRETFEVLKRPQPSLVQFTQKLTRTK